MASSLRRCILPRALRTPPRPTLCLAWARAYARSTPPATPLAQFAARLNPVTRARAWCTGASTRAWWALRARQTALLAAHVSLTSPHLSQAHAAQGLNLFFLVHLLYAQIGRISMVRPHPLPSIHPLTKTPRTDVRPLHAPHLRHVRRARPRGPPLPAAPPRAARARRPPRRRVAPCPRADGLQAPSRAARGRRVRRPHGAPRAVRRARFGAPRACVDRGRQRGVVPRFEGIRACADGAGARAHCC